MSLQERERATYEDIWSLDSYAEVSLGERYAKVFESLTERPASVLDAGCGSGKGALTLRKLGYTVGMCDLTSSGLVVAARAIPMVEGVSLWDERGLQSAAYLLRTAGVGDGRFDYVYCTDVLEHIPTPFTMLVASNLLHLSKRGVFFSIGLVPDIYGAWVGRPLHQTVQRFEVWRDQLRELGKLADARDLGAAGLYFLQPTR